jgi:hypothetical protein
VSTEEDGVEEPTRSTQPSLIMAPPGLEADPDGEAADAVVNNGIMSPSRMRAGSSRSAAAQRDAVAIEDAPADDAAPAKEAMDTMPGTPAPLPADTIGKAKAKASAADGKAADQPAPDAPAAPVETKTPETSAKPSFTPSVSTLQATPAPPAGAAASTAPARPAASPSSPSSHPGEGSSSAPPASYPRPDEPARTRTSVQAQPGGGHSGGNGSSSAASAVAGAAAGVTGAAAGLATSVASAWQRRGSNGRPTGARGPQVRKPAKRQAMLTLARVEPWSVMKFSFVASVVAFIILFVAVAVLYMVLAALGVFDSLQHTVSTITGAQGTSGTDISHYYSASVVLGYTAMLGALNIVLITAMSTVGSVIYNLIAKTIGGIEVTLRETE